MSKPGTLIAPPSKNVSDMLEILADPVKYRQHLDELKAMHKEIDARVGVYNSLEKVSAYHKEVKEEAALVSKSRKDVEAALAKLEQATSALNTSKAEFAASVAQHDMEHTVRMAALAQATNTHLTNITDHEQAVAQLAADRATLSSRQAQQDKRVVKYNEKLVALHAAMKDVEAL